MRHCRLQEVQDDSTDFKQLGSGERNVVHCQHLRYHQPSVFSTCRALVLDCSSNVCTKVIQVPHGFSLFFAPVCHCYDQEWQSHTVLDLDHDQFKWLEIHASVNQLSSCTYYGMIFHSHSIKQTKLNCVVSKQPGLFSRAGLVQNSLIFLTFISQHFAKQNEPI